MAGDIRVAATPAAGSEAATLTPDEVTAGVGTPMGAVPTATVSPADAVTRAVTVTLAAVTTADAATTAAEVTMAGAASMAAADTMDAAIIRATDSVSVSDSTAARMRTATPAITPVLAIPADTTINTATGFPTRAVPLITATDRYRERFLKEACNRSRSRLSH